MFPLMTFCEFELFTDKTQRQESLRNCCSCKTAVSCYKANMNAKGVHLTPRVH